MSLLNEIKEEKTVQRMIKEQLEVITASIYSLQKILNKTYTTLKLQEKKKSPVKFIILGLIIVLTIIYILHINNIIPKEYVNEALKYVPERVFVEIDKTARQLGLK